MRRTFQYGSCRGDGTASADGSSHTGQICHLRGNFEFFTEINTQAQAQYDTCQRKKNSIGTGAQNFQKIHTAAHSNNGKPQEIGSQFPCPFFKGIADEQGKQDPAENRRSRCMTPENGKDPGHYKKECCNKNKKNLFCAYFDFIAFHNMR